MQTAVTHTSIGDGAVIVGVNVMFERREWEELRAMKEDIKETKVKAIKAAVEHFLLWG